MVGEGILLRLRLGFDNDGCVPVLIDAVNSIGADLDDSSLSRKLFSSSAFSGACKVLLFSAIVFVPSKANWYSLQASLNLAQISRVADPPSALEKGIIKS